MLVDRILLRVALVHGDRILRSGMALRMTLLRSLNWLLSRRLLGRLGSLMMLWLHVQVDRLLVRLRLLLMTTMASRVQLGATFGLQSGILLAFGCPLC